MFPFPPYLSRPLWVLPGASVDLDFINGRAWGGGMDALISVSRASGGTGLLPSSPPGAAYPSFPNNTARIVPGAGLLVETSRTNVLRDSAAPATQTTETLATGAWTLWVNGPGSAAVAAGSATGTGFGTATNGSPVTFTLTAAGSVVVTVTGSLAAFQLEQGAAGSSFIATGAVAATRASDAVIGTGALATAYGRVAGTVYAEYGPIQLNAANRVIGSNGPVSLINVNTVAQIIAMYDGSVSLSGPAAPLASVNRAAASWSPSGRSIVANGGTVGSDTRPRGTPGTLYLGSQSASIQGLMGYLRRVAFFPARRDDAILKAMTA